MTKVYAGNDLLAYLHRQTNSLLEETRVKRIIHDIAVGLSNLHKRNIVHRDIKMGNILMSDKSLAASACIADFGIALKLKS